MPKEPVKKPAVKKTVGSSAITLEELQALADAAPKRAGAGSKGGRPKGVTKSTPEEIAKRKPSDAVGERHKRRLLAKAIAEGTDHLIPADQLPASQVHDGVALFKPLAREEFGSAEDYRTHLDEFTASQNGGVGGHTHPWSKFMDENNNAHYVDFNTDNMRDSQFRTIPVEHDKNGNPSLRMRNAVNGVVSIMSAGHPDLNIKPAYLGNGIFHFNKQDKYCNDCSPRNPRATQVPPLGFN
jgi:hypothetical protein